MEYKRNLRLGVEGYTDDELSLDVHGNVNVSGNISIAGTVTYDDVTNVDSIGLITARSGIDIGYPGTATTLTADGNAVFSGIVTASQFFGDGQYLQNIISGVGVATAGGIVGTGATILDFRGAGISTVTVASGIATINITGGGSTVFNDTTTNQEFYLTFTDTTSGTITSTGISTSKLTYNPFSGEVTAVDYNSTSDQSLKTNIQTVDHALDIVSNLRGVSFDWKHIHKPSYGVIAQELEQVLPNLVGNGDIKTVNYNGIIGFLIEAIKELKQEVEELKRNKN